MKMKSHNCSQQRLWLIVSMKSCSQPGKNPGHPPAKQPSCLEFSPLYGEQHSLLFSRCRVWLFVTLWTAAHQASLSFTISRSLVKLMSIKSWCHPTISSSIAPFSSCPQSFPSSWSFPMNQLFASGGQSIGASASASVLPMNIQGWIPLGWTGLISFLSKGLSRVFSNTTIWKQQFFDAHSP